MEAGCRRVDAERVGALEVRSRRADVQTWRSGAREACCRFGDAEARGGVEVGASEALEVHCRGRVIAVWSSGALQVRCRRRVIEVWRSGALDACCVCRDA